MRSSASASGCRSKGTGFTYLWLLFVIAIAAASVAAIGQRSSVTVQREKEAELSFRGHEIERAIASYWDATPAEQKELPRTLEDLVEDRRGGALRRHMRRVWLDPFTGHADWVLIMADDGEHVRGVHSRANVPAFDIKDLGPAPPGARRLISERLFVFGPSASQPATAALATLRSE